jgi:hypothetical protein
MPGHFLADAGMKLLVAMNLVDDLDAITIERLTHFGYRGEGRDRAFDRFAMLYTYTERTVPLMRYTVRFSAEITQNPKFKIHRKALDEITSRLRNGASVRPYLSKKAVIPSHKDALLLSWGIHHLHLNSIETIGKAGFVSREHGKSELLLLRLEGQTAYLIDIVSHAEPYLFENPRLLEIVDRNWPDLHIAPNMVTGNVFTPEQIKALRSNGVNYAISVNGRTVFPKPVMAGGVPIEVQMWYRVLRDELTNVEADVRRRFYEFFPHKVSPSLTRPAIHDVRLVGIEDDFFILRDSATQRLCHARRVAAQKRNASA